MLRGAAFGPSLRQSRRTDRPPAFHAQLTRSKPRLVPPLALSRPLSSKEARPWLTHRGTALDHRSLAVPLPLLSHRIAAQPHGPHPRALGSLLARHLRSINDPSQFKRQEADDKKAPAPPPPDDKSRGPVVRFLRLVLRYLGLAFLYVLAATDYIQRGLGLIVTILIAVVFLFAVFQYAMMNSENGKALLAKRRAENRAEDKGKSDEILRHDIAWEALKGMIKRTK